jgi:hypothetical protein
MTIIRNIKSIAIIAVIGTVAIWPLRSLAQQTAQEPGFTISPVRFDESVSGTKPTPQIPKGWRFIGVSNGEKDNSNNLWFQDTEGNIYLVQGFTTYRKFILDERIQKIESAK